MERHGQICINFKFPMKRECIFPGLVGVFLGTGVVLIVFWYLGKSEECIIDNAQQQITERGIGKTSPLSVMPDTLVPGGVEQKAIEGEFSTYTNQKYAYTVSYPKKWEIDTSSADQNLSEEEFSDGSKVKSGGVVFFSNYKNIGDYTPETKPQDMFLVSVATYVKERKSMHDIVTGLGFEAYDAKDFSGKNIGGSWFFARTTDENNPMVAVIFEKDEIFYVIQPAFINGNTDVFSGVEEMAQSFEVLEKK